MFRFFDGLQAAAYTGGAAYVGWLVGNNQCPAHAHFYTCLYGPALVEAAGGFLGGLRGAPYHSNLIARLASADTPDDDKIELGAISLGAHGAIIGGLEGLAVGLTAYGTGFVVGEIVSRLF